MKNLQILLVFLVLITGCKEPQNVVGGNSGTSPVSEDPLNPMGIDSTKLIEGEYLFFLDNVKYSPLINVDDPTFNYKVVDFKKVDLLKEKIIADVENAFNLKLDKKYVFATTFSGFFVSNMSRVQAMEIISNTSIILSAQNNFTFQNIIARMQSPGPILQNVIARMQEWQYDAEKKTSSKVLYVRPVLTPGDLIRKIWIVDSGVDANHTDLNVVRDPAFSISYVNTEPDPLVDIIGHGTHCAGIAAGKANMTTGLGMNGVSPGAPIVSVKVINWNGEGKWVDVLFALDHIVTNSSSGDVVNLSLGGLLPGNNPCTFQMGILNQIKALSNKQVFVVMAAGNTNVNSKEFYPGCFDCVNPGCPTTNKIFTVGSLNVTFNFSPGGGFSMPTFSTYSNFGAPPIDYVAPGDFVFSTFPFNRYAILSGTSMATAMVSGIIHAKGSEPNGIEKLIGPPGSTSYSIAKY